VIGSQDQQYADSLDVVDSGQRTVRLRQRNILQQSTITCTCKISNKWWVSNKCWPS